jgi:hypothetical protein
VWSQLVACAIFIIVVLGRNAAAQHADCKATQLGCTRQHASTCLHVCCFTLDEKRDRLHVVALLSVCSHVHDHLADPEEKAGTIPQWIKQLHHTSHLDSATIRARLDSISAALAPAAAADAAASHSSRRLVGSVRSGQCCGVDAATSPMRAVQSAAVMSPTGMNFNKNIHYMLHTNKRGNPM